ncbi:foldase protein PrsA [Paenibacillus castaneae]|uniref:foldase protein PrsA n=1 Tax=Paenibacillus castaneae TaxID=474957 RepID=UPI000C9C6E1A|nr:peptidylprolyl isomerase [Paenibacillus castaneae]NIK78149.1 foldase protein PrsA [Paenibacillus castaneae]
MNNNESQSKKDAENELAANEDRNTNENNEQQDMLSEQDAAIENELLSRSEVASTAAVDNGFNAPIPAAAPAAKGGSNMVWIAISAVLAIALIVVLLLPSLGGSNATVATVNGEKISKDKLYDALVAAGGPATLDNLITEQLIQQEAKAGSITVSDADVDAEIKLIKENFGTDEEFNSVLAQYNMTLDSLKKDTRINLTIRKILEPKTKVTDEDVKAYYDANKESLGTPEQIQASHILVATKEEADAILAELKQGGDFATIAKEKSTDTGSAQNGGDLGFFGKGDMVAEFETAAFALKVNEISGVVQSQHGFHIIKKTAEKAAVVPTFEEKKEDIRKQLVATEANELSQSWMTEIREKAKITNTLAPETKASDEATK